MKYLKFILFCTIIMILLSSYQTAKAESDLDKTAIKYQSSTEHFDFYCTEKDAVTIKDLQQALETSYLKITNDLQTKFVNKIRVDIYPDIKSYHQAMNVPNAPDWVVGGSGKDRINMVSPLTPGKSHDYKSLMRTIVHEFTHVAIRNLVGTGGIPRWLNEGFAYYEAGQYMDNYRKMIKTKVVQNKIPTFNELEKSDSVKFGEIDGYGFSTTIIEYLIKKYGMDNLAKFINKSYSTLEPFGITKDQLEKDWNNYLKEEYGK